MRYIGISQKRVASELQLTVQLFCLSFVNQDPSGQVIVNSHDLTPNGGSVLEITLFQGNLGW